MIERATIEEALAAVYDPCSVQASAPLSVVDMGLVTAIDIAADGSVRVELKPTSPWCTMIGSIMQGVETQVAKVTGVTSVVADIARGASWSEADMTAEGRSILGATRARSRAAVPVRQRQWQERIVETSEA